MEHEIYIIDNETIIYEELKTEFKDEGSFHFRNYKDENIEIALKNIPELIIVNEDNINIPIIEVCNIIRQDDDNSITPIIVISSKNNKSHKIEILKNSVEYYIQSTDKECLYYSIKNILRLININRRVSPLTGLPGNVQIHAELKKRLANKESFAVLYFDLDNFKAYNDVYGFLKGDEIIRFTARVIQKHINQNFENHSFVRTYWRGRFCCHYKYRRL